MKKNTKKGFTLVELLVVIAILAILASVAVVGYTSFIKKADDQAAATEFDQVETIITNALIVEESVTVKVDSVDYILTKSATGIVATAAGATDISKMTSITDDIGELIEKLNFADGVLSYTYKTGYDAMALTVVAE